MKDKFLIILFLSGILALQPGCKRKTPEGELVSPDESSQAVAKYESGIEMVQIPAGRFTMGDEDEIDATPHEVVLSSFYMDTTLVTQAQYQKLMGDNPSRWKVEENPVEQVRW